MAQFDVFRNPNKGGFFPLLLDVQSDQLSLLATRVVVPMVPTKKFGIKPITRLNPALQVRGVDYVLVFQELAAVPTSSLAEPIDSLTLHRTELIAALDLLLTGT